jgi:hypothetical protein
MAAAATKATDEVVVAALEPLKVPYELRLGVVGHRELPDSDRVAAAVDSLLDHINATLNRQDQTPLKWTIVSALARGADQVVARCVLKRADARLEVVTPFPLVDYRKDFVASRDRDEFEALLQQALPEHITELDGDYGTQVIDDDPETKRQVHDKRNHAYLEAGRRVVDSCEIVIAVWDGKAAAGVGGTGEAVAYALRAQRVVLWIDTEQPLTAARQVIGLGRPTGQEGRAPEHKCLPLPATPKSLSIGYHQLTAYMTDRAIAPDVLARAVQAEAGKLGALVSEIGLPFSNMRPVIAYLLPHHVRADRLATHYQQLHVRTTKALHSLAAAAVTVVVVQVLFFEDRLWLIAFEIVALCAAVAWFFICRRQAWHEKWLHDRFLSERLRAAMFTLLLGPTNLGTAEVQSVLPFYAGPQNWLAATVQQLVNAARQAAGPVGALGPLKLFLLEGWLKPQAQWHERTAREKHAAMHLAHSVELGFFAGTVALAILHFYGVGHTAEQHQYTVLVVGNWITFLAIVLPAWGAAVHAIMTQLEYERISIRSQRMATALSIVAERCERAETIEALRQEVRDGERVVGIENHEWWVLLSFRPPALPI